MNKRHALLLTAALGMAAAQTSTTTASPAAQTSLAPNAAPTIAPDPQLSKATITVNVGVYSGPLSSLLAALAKAAGYEVIFDANVDSLNTAANLAAAPAAGVATIPATPAAATAAGSTTARPLVLSFTDKPFNEVWPLLMDVYGLSYQTLPLGGKTLLRVGNTPPTVQRIYTARGTQADVLALLTAQYPTLRVSAVGQTGQLVLSGSQTQIDSALALLTQVDRPVISTVDTSPAMQRVYAVNGQQADVLALLTAQFPTLRVTGVGQTGQLVLSGQQSQLDAALALLAQVDRAPTPVPTAEISPTVQRVYTVKGQQADVSALLTAQFPTLKVTGVGKTGPLVLTGPQTQIEAALALLAQVDLTPPVAAQTTQRIFTIANGKAEEIKAVLENTLAASVSANSITQSVAGGSAGTGSIVTGVNVGGTPAAQPAATPTPATNPLGTLLGQTGSTAGSEQVSPATIIADKRTNTLIVRGTAQQVAQVAELIPTLDVRVPQINLQVRINEITETGLRTLGVGYKASLGGFNVSLTNGQLAASFDPLRAFTGFNLGATLDSLEQQGMTKRVYDGTVMMQSGQTNGSGSGGGTFRCGSPDDQSNIAAASLQSGGRLDINIPGSGGSAPVVRTIPYGVNMYFLDPSVNADGTVSVRLCGQVNQPRTAITNTLPSLLDFANSSAQTVVSFKNGETLLLSGLLGSNEVSTRKGLPYVSSIPVIGALLGGSENVTKDSTQLLVIVTGTVVK
ncbi:type II secretion system protein GspD [Deinococcus sp. QL22]|uniref:type II secretion system protein GspD n=1 Tax=Deinococcus sp. QL22 TaxID=2939437 RepID=UPI0020183B21|nr:secretin N-terminal domain-containing protein [Deinococcus sp. QL22]UQN07050.1 secretin [Deinococcus sp. QL22]